MESDKNVVSADLYSLRAGLSVISKIADKKRLLEERMAQIKNELKETEYLLEIESGNLIAIKKALKNEKLRYKKTIKDTIRKERPGDVFIFLVYTFWFLPVSLPILIVVYIIQKNKAKKKGEKIFASYVKEKELLVEQSESQTKALQQKIAKLQKEYDDLVEERNEYKSKQGIIAGVYKKALENSYGKLVNKSDWENIDLIIFYLQTGRADTLKECLQLVDKQKQTDQIVNAIDRASSSICSTIKAGVMALGEVMVSGFNSLSNQINVLGEQILSQQSDMIKAMGKIQATDSALLSATQLSNALQEKANTTSAQLMRDYEYVNQLSRNF